MKKIVVITEKFTGKEFWRTLNFIIFFVMYALMFIVPLFFPDYIWTITIIMVFLIMLYITIQQFVYRKMERKNAGRRVLYGWIDEEEDMGEEYEIPIKKISPFDRLSESDQKAVDEFMKMEKSRMSAIGLREQKIKNFIMNGFQTSEDKTQQGLIEDQTTEEESVETMTELYEEMEKYEEEYEQEEEYEEDEEDGQD